MSSCLVKRCKTSDRMPHSCWWCRVSLAEGTIGTPPTTRTRTGMSSSTSAEEEGDEMASSCPSNWLKEGSLSPLPTDTTRRCPSEAGGEGRMLRGFGAANGALGAGVDVASPGPGVAGGRFRFRLLGSWDCSCWCSSFCSLVSCCPGSRLSLGRRSPVARTTNSSRCWGSRLESFGSAQMRRGRSRAGTRSLSQLDLKLGSHNTLHGSGGQGCLTSSRPDPTEVAIELVQLGLVGVQHLEVDLTFFC